MATITHSIKGGHLFGALYPMYVNISSGGTYVLNRLSVDDYFFVSVNGGDFADLSWGTVPSGAINLNLNAGVNRIIVLYFNVAWSGAYLVFNIGGITTYYQPDLAGCIGQPLKSCIPARSNITGLSTDIRALFYYYGAEGSPGGGCGTTAPPEMSVAKSTFLAEPPRYHPQWLKKSDLNKSTTLVPSTQAQITSGGGNQFKFWTDQRELCGFSRYPGSVEWPSVVVERPAIRRVTFRVDMRIQLALNRFSTSEFVQVRGSFNGWSGVNQMLDVDQDGIYTLGVDIEGNPDTDIEFKFFTTGGLQFESIQGNRSFTLGADGVNQTTAIYMFNNEASLPAMLVRTNALNDLYLGAARVDRVYLGDNSIYIKPV